MVAPSPGAEEAGPAGLQTEGDGAHAGSTCVCEAANAVLWVAPSLGVHRARGLRWVALRIWRLNAEVWLRCRGSCSHGQRLPGHAAGARFQSLFAAALREWPSCPISQMWMDMAALKSHVSCSRPRGYRRAACDSKPGLCQTKPFFAATSLAGLWRGPPPPHSPAGGTVWVPGLHLPPWPGSLSPSVAPQFSQRPGWTSPRGLQFLAPRPQSAVVRPPLPEKWGQRFFLRRSRNSKQGSRNPHGDHPGDGGRLFFLECESE